MYIIIKKIPISLTINDLERIIIPAIERNFFHKTGYIKATKIIQLVNKKKIEIERHGLVRLDSDSTQKHLITSLNGRTIRNETIFVAGYVVRHWSNDRRTASRNLPPPPNDERVGERRRHGLRMLVLCEKLT